MERREGMAPLTAGSMRWSYYPLGQTRDTDKYFTDLAPQIANVIITALRGERQLRVGRELRVRVLSYHLQARLEYIDPPLATVMGDHTQVIAQLRSPTAEETRIGSFLAETIRYPNAQAGQMYQSLVGIDEIRNDLYRKLLLLVSPGYLKTWASQFYSEQPAELLQALNSRYPLVVLEGDVGTGKTALARSIGNHLAEKLSEQLVLYVMNAQVRGSGLVGEMTQNISDAFDEAERCEEKEQIPTMLLIDEADSLAGARGSQRTHHEDDAGVNTLIQRIDRLRGRRMAVIFATNLAQSLDSAILRRAVATYHFSRPSAQQRSALFARLLHGTDISTRDVNELVKATEPRIIDGFGDKPHRFTYSDITQRIVPSAVEMAVFSQQRLALDLLLRVCQHVAPTPEMPRRASDR